MKKARFGALEPRWILVFVFFIAGGFTGGLLTYLLTAINQPTSVKYHLSSASHKYTNPTLVSEPTTAGDFSSVNTALQVKVRGIINRAEAGGAITNVGLYFRDLEPGNWLAINANESFSPGTLLKIPIMITYYKLAEHTPGLLNETVTASLPVVERGDLFATGDSLVPGQEYVVSDLIERMIVNSDDYAASLLFRHVDKVALSEIFSDLGIDFQESEIGQDVISLRRYSLFFRTLYNATYLSNDYSEKALELLVKNNPGSLLQANLPESITFASRLGGHTIKQQSGTVKEVYECDIVYYAKHDYVLCVVAHGQSIDALSKFFAALGSAFYENAQYQYGSGQ